MTTGKPQIQKTRNKKREDGVYKAVSEYLSLKYPKIVWRFDYGAGMKMTRGQAGRQKSLNPHRGYPDLFIAEPKGKYAGLYLEIKADGKNPFRKDGVIKSEEHLVEQHSMLQTLAKKGYFAEFAVGFDECMQKIDKYLNQ